MLSFATLIGKLFWIKNQDHVRERLWQHLLSYLSYHYYVMVYNRRLLADHVFPLDKHDSLYVPSAAVRDNDITVNPLGQRRFTIIRGLAQTPAVQVGIPDFGHISTPSLFFGVTPTPFISIIDHLNCPTSVYASIGDTIYSFAQSVYQVVDIHARVGLYYPNFTRSFDGIVADGRYFDTILFLDNLLRHYSSHSVLPKYLVHDLTTGCFYAGLARIKWAIHLRQAQGAFTRTSDHRTYITENRLWMIQELQAQTYVEMTDDQLQLVICTIQQLLVEHALYLHGPMSLSHVRAAEEHLQYQPPSHIPINHVTFWDLMYKSYIPIYSSFIIIKMMVFCTVMKVFPTMPVSF
jgi:hypothetical protein